MASGGKPPRKFGGVKKDASKSRGRPATVSDGSTCKPSGDLASTPPAKPARTFGGVKVRPRGTGTGKAVGFCPENCPGEFIAGNWIHSRACQWAPVRWGVHGFTEADWRCSHGCTPVPVNGGWTHPDACPYWTGYERQAIQSEGASTGASIVPDGTNPHVKPGDLPF